MNWTQPVDLRAQVQKLWDRGELLAMLVQGEPDFPKRLVLKCPTSAEMTERFGEVRSWIAELAATPCVRIEMRSFSHRVFGNNVVPQSAWIDSLEEAFSFIGKQRDAARFRTLIEQSRQRLPAVLPWLARRPLRGLALAADWRQLLDIVLWIQQHPRPGIYLRQVDIPGVHSKFIESYRGVLSELLDLVLPQDAIDASRSGATQFATRYGFRDKPVRIRFRVLDPRLILLSGSLCPDVAVDAVNFAALQPAVRQVFITENETNFLAFPNVPDSLVIFGAGYGWEALSQAAWLNACTIRYWGDIDTHGFAILDQLRARFSHVESLLMDRATLMAHQTSWGTEREQVLHDLPRLGPEEMSLFDDLRHDRIQAGLRLEQEYIGYQRLESLLRT
ncbi:MAG: Wadjet anti-phage system protein JetD domain-containing protein [Collimonas sp.]|uniref:DUF3322 domain-containing protein n=1 Tax=Collimonas sp. TaxID=1963772 RepID=UPI003266F64B